MENIENQPSREEIAKLEKSRVISDSELLQNGAEYEIGENGDKKLIPTSQQVESAKFDMELDLEEKRTLTDKMRLAIADKNKETINRLFVEFKEKYEPMLRDSMEGFNVSVFGESANRYRSSFFEDVIQETFIKAYEKIDELTELENIGGWLNIVCRREFIDHVRKTRSRDARESEQYLAQLSLENDAVSAEPDPAEMLSHEELLAIIRESVNRIASPVIRDTAKMDFIEGLDPETIMAKQNINRENYHKRVQRARKDVKDRLDLMGLKEDEVFPLLK